jgi:hypothetical protein
MQNRTPYNSPFGPHEEYTVMLHGTAWQLADAPALLAAWKATRDLGLGLTPEESDQIAYAAIHAIRDMVERRALDQRGPGPAAHPLGRLYTDYTKE